MKKCPFCAEEISFEAIKCKHCGEILDDQIRAERQQATLLPQQKERKWSPGVAALLSLLIPGAGQIYKGNVFRGLIWLVVVALSYFSLFDLGIVLHLICIVTASLGDPYR